ncbi:hypothetical protein SATRI_v1c05320 [Spiroplasma atrichopogonis]|nr:hypothetical protein SATRI_v1c05320 [Spiroplasma atrichopogonis]
MDLTRFVDSIKLKIENFKANFNENLEKTELINLEAKYDNNIKILTDVEDIKYVEISKPLLNKICKELLTTIPEYKDVDSKAFLQEKIAENENLELFIYSFEKLAHNEIYKYNQDDPRFFKNYKQWLKKFTIFY